MPLPKLVVPTYEANARISISKIMSRKRPGQGGTSLYLLLVHRPDPHLKTTNRFDDAAGLFRSYDLNALVFLLFQQMFVSGNDEMCLVL